MKDKPSLIICRTIIGFGSPNKAGSEESHGAALGEKEVALARQQLGWKYPSVRDPERDLRRLGCASARESGARLEREFAAYQQQFPELAAELTRRMNGALPEDFAAIARDYVAKLQAEPAKIASRKASQNALNAYGPHLPELLGGSADLAPSNLTIWSGSTSIKEDPAGNYIHYGVREFGMTAVANGIALHGGFIPYTSTFLMFVEYARNAARMAALMKARQIMVYTHDSIGLGGRRADAPGGGTAGQSAADAQLQHLAPLRPVGTAVAWQAAIARQGGPTALILSRQNLAQMPRTPEQVQDIARGGYVLKDAGGKPDLILIATGSEVEITVLAAEKLLAKGVNVRVVSLPSTDVFDARG